ncbi:MAG: hypothetical protein GWN58_19835, partial [Anaerolineae bacterium]|nr:hypothetical protein [Anaerolineae bacterium]
RVNILGKYYRIEESPTLIEMDDACGKTLCHKALILVDPTQDFQQLQDTLLHEVVHAVYSEMGLTNEIKDELEETIVQRMSTGILQVLKANPGFTKLITRKPPDGE